MFCRKCGKQIPDGTQFCTYCGAPQVSTTAANPTVTKQTTSTALAAPKAPKKPMDPAKKKKLQITLGIVGICVVAAGVGIYFVTNMPTKVNMLQDTTVSFNGFDGFGTVDVDFDLSNTKFYKDYMEVYDDYFSSLGTNKTATDKYERLSKLGDSISCNWTTDVNGTLSNGDEITYSCTVDEALAKKLKYEFVDTEKTFTVEGLEETKVVDLFADMDVYWDFGTYYTRVVAENKSTDPYVKNLYYNVSDVDASGNVTVTFYSDADELAHYGYAAKDNAFEKVYNVGTKPIKITDVDAAADATQAATDAATTAVNAVLDTCGWQVYKDGNPIDIYEANFVKFGTSWGDVVAVYDVVTSDGTYSKQIELNLYRMGDGSIYDATVAPTGCEVSANKYSGNHWYN